MAVVEDFSFGLEREAAIELDDRRQRRRARRRESARDGRSGRSNAVAPADARAVGLPLEDAKLFLGQAGSAFAGDLGEHFIELGVELFFGDDGGRRDLPALPTVADVRDGFGDRVRVCSRGTGEKMRSLGLKTRPENNRDQRKSNCLNRNAKPARPDETRRRCASRPPPRIGNKGRRDRCVNSTHIGIGMKKNRISRLG